MFNMRQCMGDGCTVMIEFPANFCPECKAKARVAKLKRRAMKKAASLGRAYKEKDTTCREIKCLHCGKKFMQTSYQQKYCSQPCCKKFNIRKRMEEGYVPPPRPSRAIVPRPEPEPLMPVDCITILNRFVADHYQRWDARDIEEEWLEAA